MYLQTALFLVLAVSGLTWGAPAELSPKHPPVSDEAVCGSQIPHDNGEGVKSPHGLPQNSNSPYNIAFSESPLAPGSSIQVTISGQHQQPIRGLVMKAKCGEEIVGSFSSDSVKVDLRNCGGVKKSGVLYIDMERRDVQEITLTWTAPSESCNVVFDALVMKDGSTYWMQKQSLSVAAKSKD